jgi:RNA polymerase sigma-70 factor (ECF subfamily)
MDGPTIKNPLEKGNRAKGRAGRADINNRLTFSDDILAEIPRLRRYAFVLLRDQGSADDLVQDTLERALSRQKLFQPGTNLRAWLFTIMHNMHVNAVIKARRAPPAGTTDDIAESHRSAVPPSQGDRLMLRDLERALDTLSEEQRSVVLLIGVEGLSYAETASVLDVPVGTVMSRLARGRSRLRSLMNGEDREPPERKQ